MKGLDLGGFGGGQPAAGREPRTLPEPAPQSEQVVQQWPFNWVQLRNKAFSFFVNSLTMEISMDVPMDLQTVQQQLAQMQQAQAQAQQQPRPVLPVQPQAAPGPYAPMPAMQQPPQQPQAMQAPPPDAGLGTTHVHARIGDWVICEDAQGVFYHNQGTDESFDKPPPELVEAFQQSRSQAQLFMQQPQQVLPQQLQKPQGPPQQQQPPPQQLHQQQQRLQEQQARVYQQQLQEVPFAQVPYGDYADHMLQPDANM